MQVAYAYEQATQTRSQVKLMVEPNIETQHKRRARMKINRV